jgi:hypothetical protein
LKAREIVVEAESERERVRAEIRNLRTARSEIRASYRAFLQAALERLDVEVEPDTRFEPLLELPEDGELPEPEHTEIRAEAPSEAI